MLLLLTNNPQFHNSVLFTDELSFTKECLFNTHNEHVWAGNNPHLTTLSKYQERFSVNVSAGIFSDHLVGPYLLPDSLTGEKYLVFLERVLPNLLWPVPSIAQQMLLDRTWWTSDLACTLTRSQSTRFLFLGTYDILDILVA